MQESERNFNVQTSFLPAEVLRYLPPPDAPGPVDQDLARALSSQVARPFSVDWNDLPGVIVVNVQMQGGVLCVEVPRKRLFIGSFYLFLVWLTGTALLVFGVAALFLRTQVRGITRLAEAAEAFGMGRDVGPMRPEGASEVRRAATAFNRMRERLRRFLTQRTTMLAGISHDLRTPLTRLRLALAMQPCMSPEDEADMISDIEEMERLIAIYLSFARGEGSEQAVVTDVAGLLEDVCAASRRGGASVSLSVTDGLVARLRPEAMRRALTNLIDNAARHGSHIWVSAHPIGDAGARVFRILIDDDGPGIPEEKRATLLKPFESDDPGGTGLGLAIARDIIGAHGGDVLLLDRPSGGLRVSIELPL
jgi:two-component system osmolarity sensor histidine kinase EnvZ